METGIDVTYAGLSRIVTERGLATDGDDSPPGVKTATSDVFGRLVSVVENAGTSEAAETAYEYTASGQLRNVIDAEENVTELVHDWAGRRTKIKRQGRTWRYVYDLNGNLIHEIAPVPAGASEGAYTTTFEYDGEPEERLGEHKGPERDLRRGRPVHV